MAMFMESDSFSMTLIPIDSIELELFPRNLTSEERHKRFAQLSKARTMELGAMSSRSSGNSMLSNDQQIGKSYLQPSMKHMPYNYYAVSTVVGTKLYKPFLALELSRSDTWMQCHGCRRCFRLQGGNFNYEQSTSFQRLKCNHTLCIPNTCDAERVNCLYQDSYYSFGDTKGFVGTDTFHFPTGNPSAPTRTFRNLAFGCGISNHLSIKNPNNAIAGVLSLSNGRRSFLHQMGQQRFSYCLPRLGSSTTLYFGNEAQISRASQQYAQTTTFVQGKTMYHLKVSGISVQETRLQIDPILFRLSPNGTGGFLIDLGNPYTMLIKEAYNVLKNAVIGHFLRRYGLNYVPGLVPPYDLCYARDGRNIIRPSVTIHFERGANLELHHTAIFHDFQNGFCITILPIERPGPSILGTYQQTGHRFVFDIGASTISFARENCTHNRGFM